MIGYEDHLEIICQNIQQQQLQFLSQKSPSIYEGCQTRMAAYATQGYVAWQRILTSTSISQTKIEACLMLARQEVQFSFLQDISTLIELSTARSIALESSLFGTSSEAVTELTILLDLLTTLLDGLMDEAPIFLIPEQDLLFDILVQQDWAKTGILPVYVPREDRHPIVALLYDVLLEIIRRIVQCEPWQTDAVLREHCSSATRAAFSAEYESVHHTLDKIPSTNLSTYQHALQARAINWVRIIALAPLCMHGRPTALVLDGYDQFIQQLGLYSVWLDDMADIVPDLKQNRWSNVLLDLYTYLPEPAQRLPTDLQPALISALALDSVTDRLIETGGKLYDQLICSLDQLPSDSSALILVFADLAQSFLDKHRNTVPLRITDQ